MTPTSRSGTLSSGVVAEDGSWEMADGEVPADFIDGADSTAGAKPIRNGVCWTGFGGSTTGNDFNFSGKFGKAGEENSGAGFVSTDLPIVSVWPSPRFCVSAPGFVSGFSGSAWNASNVSLTAWPTSFRISNSR